MTLTGKIRVDRKTKKLVQRIKPGEIAIIDHEDLDELAVFSLIKARVKAVINARPSMTGKYPNQGPLLLLKHKIPLVDNVGSVVMELPEGQLINIMDNKIYINNKIFYAQGIRQTWENLQDMLEYSKKNLPCRLESFIDNTLSIAGRERDFILQKLAVPQLITTIKGRHTLIVVRGQSYMEDLKAISIYISDLKPVLIGVDGGADALREAGYRPDIIIGDMDSVSDKTLQSGAELIVHAYTDGKAPGMERIKKLGLTATTFSVSGTSEDAAMLLVQECGTELIVAVGTHTSMIDFLDKGRRGMSSTILTRIKVGNILVDAKGVSKLYSGKQELRHVLKVVMAACLPLIFIASTSSLLSQFGRLFWLKLRLLFNM